METQLIRHDKPYNVIFGSNGKFALHIATLIVITEEEQKDHQGKIISRKFVTHSYPVVSSKYYLDGEPWMDVEQKDCLAICRAGDPFYLFMLKRVMEFCAKKEVSIFKELTPSTFFFYLKNFGCKFVLSSKDKEYSVCLEFEESDNRDTCMVYADKKSDLYFCEYFALSENVTNKIQTKESAIRQIRMLRDRYNIYIDKIDSITFRTENKKYQWFVDQLNATKIDEA